MTKSRETKIYMTAECADVLREQLEHILNLESVKVTGIVVKTANTESLVTGQATDEIEVNIVTYPLYIVGGNGND